MELQHGLELQRGGLQPRVAARRNPGHPAPAGLGAGPRPRAAERFEGEPGEVSRDFGRFPAYTKRPIHRTAAVMLSINLGNKFRELRISVKVPKHKENTLSEHMHIFAENRLGETTPE